MKNNFIYLLLFFSLIAQAQVTPSYPTIKLTKTVEGVKQDSLLVIGTDKTVKHIPLSKISNVQEYATASALPLTGVAGKLYITKDNNKIYTWNGTFYSEFFGAKGEKGDQGPQGIQGLKGDQGIQGIQGVAGLTGLKGDKGDVGLTGSIGLTGAKGDKGDIGLTGVAGTNGLDGAKGDQGIQGIQGFKGDTGLTGADGAMGVQGPQGIQGIQGETGLRGIQGETGPQGPIGFTGAKGADGTGVAIKGSLNNISELPASGADGDAYLISGNLHVWNGTAWINVGNIQGPQGLIGLTGATGSQGIQGVKGDKGDQGIQGIQGIQGLKGDTGSFNGDITADQVTETATRKFQTANQNTFNDATSSIQGQLNSKENAFSKNTAFNKNFGTASGTVAEGNDSRILNGQTAFSWGNHAGKYPLYNGTGATGNWGINISGLAANSTLWNGERFGINSSSTVSDFLGYNTTSARWEPKNISETKIALGINNLSGTGSRIVIADASGKLSSPTNFTHTGAITATSTVTATSFNGSATLTGTPTAPTATAGTNTTQIANTAFVAGGLATKENAFSKNTAFNKNFGTTAGTVVEGGTLGSNAYTSTSYLPLSGGTLSGNIKLNGLLLSDNFTGASKQVLNPTATVLYLGNTNLSNINYESATRHEFYVGSTIRGRFDSSGLFVDGAATFSSSVTATPATVDAELATLGQAKAVASNYLPLSGGTVSGTITASGFFQSSDRRLKNIFKRDGDVAYFTWKDGRDNKEHIGYIAQEVRRTNPNQVQADDKGILSVNYVEILVEKIRVLEKRIEQLEKGK